MKGFYSILILLLTGLMVLYGCKKSNEDKTVIRMAVAANMQYAIRELADQFEKDTGFTCEVILGSSGKLFAQIKEGAPFDIFISADLTYPEALHAIDLTYEPPKIYAYGTLVLWTYSSALKPSLEVLQTDSVQHIALANPKTAPYGKAALEVLDFYGLSATLQDKFVYGESIGQTNQFITSGAANIGFTSQSVVLSRAMKNKGEWLRINDTAYTPMPQGVVLIKRKKPKKRGAQTFYEYLFSEEGKDILQKFGYSVHE